MSKCALSTYDNPFNPFEDFSSWYRYDIDKGYDCCGFLDRVARTSSQMTDKENEEEIERAIDEIIKYDFMNVYKKVRETKNSKLKV